MTHVTDDSADRPLGPRLRDWLDDSIEELPEGRELPSSIRSDVLTRLPSTHQRRGWWPFRWFPFGIGATRSADAKEPRPQGRFKSMFNATRVAAAVAILALGGSLAIIAGPPASGPVAPPGATSSDAPQQSVPAFPVTGTAEIVILAPGDNTDSLLRNRVGGTVRTEMNDPRVSGDGRFLHHADDYGLVGLEWGTYRVENEDGAWQGPVSGFYGFYETRTSGWLAGEGAYEGLTYYIESVIDHSTSMMEINGMVFPGVPPTSFPELDAAD
jgi:hypothetical protein